MVSPSASSPRKQKVLWDSEQLYSLRGAWALRKSLSQPCYTNVVISAMCYLCILPPVHSDFQSGTAQTGGSKHAQPFSAGMNSEPRPLCPGSPPLPGIWKLTYRGFRKSYCFHFPSLQSLIIRNDPRASFLLFYKNLSITIADLNFSQFSYKKRVLHDHKIPNIYFYQVSG